MFRVGFGPHVNIAMATLAIYPPVDQFAIIYVIKDFRTAIGDLAMTSEKLGLCLAPALNCVLLLLLFFKSNPKFGSYKYLMISYTIIAFLYSCIGYSTSAGAHSTNTTYVVFRMYNGPNRDVAPVFLLQYCTAIFVLLLILAIHFIYRYFAVCNTKLLYLFKGHRIAYWILGAIGVGIFESSLKYLFLGENSAATENLRQEFMEEYGLTMVQICYNGPIYYICDKDNQCRRDPYIWAVSIFIQASCFGCFLLMSSFGCLTYTRLNTLYTNLSVHTCQIQHQLLIALLIQAGIPIIFMYIPIAVLFTFPMFGIGFGVYGNITMACLAIYPPLDQIATMYVIRDFRDAIRNVLTVRKSDLARVSMTSESANRSRNWHYQH